MRAERRVDRASAGRRGIRALQAVAALGAALALGTAAPAPGAPAQAPDPAPLYLPAIVRDGRAAGTDVVLLLDVSADAAPYLPAMPEAVRALAEALDPERDRLAAIAYAEEPRLVAPLGAPPSSWSDGLPGLRPEGAARWDRALRHARRYLLGLEGPSHAWRERPVVVLLAAGASAGTANEVLSESFWTGTAGIGVVGVALGDTADRVLLERASDRTFAARLPADASDALGRLGAWLHRREAVDAWQADAGRAPEARPDRAADPDFVPAWPVLRPASSDLPMGPELLANGDFEAGDAEGADGWRPYVDGYAMDPDGGRDGSRALRLDNEPATAAHGALQVVAVNQDAPRPLFVAGWSRAEAVTGTVDAGYSVYLDLRYTDGTPLYGQRLDFDVGSHGWQRLERFIVPAKPVESVRVYCLLRHTHGGTAWFDDLTLREVDAALAEFDGAAMAVLGRSDDLPAAPRLSVAASDGLALALGPGGAVAGLSGSDGELADPARAHLGGLLVRDAEARGDVVAAGGRLARDGDTVTQAATLERMGLALAATFVPARDRISIRLAVTDTRGADRAVTLYYALPLRRDGLQWHHDFRTTRPVEGRSELANLAGPRGLGAIGIASRYPWAAVGGPSGGLAVAVPLDAPRVFRLVQNPITGQLYAAFDLGLSPATAKFPSRAWADLELYPVDPAWGFRAAAQGYYHRHPEWFTRRVPAEEEGVWVAFSDLSPIPRIEDFGIAFHELGGLSQVAFDDTVGIHSFRYIAEPWSHWLAVQDPAVDPADYDQAVGYLHARAEAGDARSQATVTSAFHDEDGRLVYDATVAPWCSGAGGCAVFTVNPDPDVEDAAAYSINKGRFEWTSADRATYDETGLDGEYIDSYLGRASTLDLRRAHFAATDTPLSFRTSDRAVGIPQVFATTEFARWVTEDVHEELGKWTMANGMLLDSPWGADLFDFMGTETNWLRTGTLVPETDERMMYRRALSYRRPYGTLMNTDFSLLTHDRVERYFQACLFYAVYPSMFSHDASSDRYWDDPTLYERDRPLFRRYVPLVRRLSAAGWEPLTHARSPDPTVLVERYGRWPDLYLALRNVGEAALEARVTVDAPYVGLPPFATGARALVADAPVPIGFGAASERTVSVPLEPGATEVLFLGAGGGAAARLPWARR